MARTKPPVGMDRTPGTAKVRHPVARAAVIKAKQARPASPVKQSVWFNSRSTTGPLAYLSNFQRLPEGACLPKGLCLLLPRGAFPGLALTADATSVEAGLVDAKISLAAGSPEAKAAARAAVAACTTGAAVKLAGGPPAFRRGGLSLDSARYDAVAPGIMEALLRARARVDSRFCDIVRDLSVPRDGVVSVLRHFARGLHYRTGDDGQGVYTRENSVAARNAEALGPLIQNIVAELDEVTKATTAPHPALE